MARNRVSLLDRDEALEICAKIKAKHPDILERRPDGLYRFLVGGEDLRQVLFDYLACDRVAAAWARKRPAKDNDLERKQQAEEVATLMSLAERHGPAQDAGRSTSPSSTYSVIDWHETQPIEDETRGDKHCKKNHDDKYQRHNRSHHLHRSRS